MDKEQQRIYEISQQINKLQEPIRILDAIKWDESIQQDFFKHKGNKLPAVDQTYYQQHPLPFDADATISAFHEVILTIKKQLGMFSNIGTIMVKLCEEYIKAIEMLKARGTPVFSQLAQELYGAPDNAFYPGGPRLAEVGTLLADIFKQLTQDLRSELDEKIYSAAEAAEILQHRLSDFFELKDQVTAEVSDEMIADAAAGATTIKLNSKVRFSKRDLKYLEVHEGWVHIGTTLNGLNQPICTFLAKGSPSSSVTQEGLAVLTEMVSFNSYPKRMLKITNRIRALTLIQQGANFLDIYRYLQEQGLTDQESYQYAVRVFRGSTPDGGPFTKDLSYAKGFTLIYNYMRLAIQQRKLEYIPMFFVGKTLLEDIPILTELADIGLIAPPKYLPPQFKDLSALSAWMGFSLFFNKFDLKTLSKYLKL